jgi:hypothetical protein
LIAIARLPAVDSYGCICILYLALQYKKGSNGYVEIKDYHVNTYGVLNNSKQAKLTSVPYQDAPYKSIQAKLTSVPYQDAPYKSIQANPFSEAKVSSEPSYGAPSLSIQAKVSSVAYYHAPSKSIQAKPPSLFSYRAPSISIQAKLTLVPSGAPSSSRAPIPKSSSIPAITVDYVSKHQGIRRQFTAVFEIGIAVLAYMFGG